MTEMPPIEHDGRTAELLGDIHPSYEGVNAPHFQAGSPPRSISEMSADELAVRYAEDIALEPAPAPQPAPRQPVVELPTRGHNNWVDPASQEDLSSEEALKQTETNSKGAEVARFVLGKFSEN